MMTEQLPNGVFIRFHEPIRPGDIIDYWNVPANEWHALTVHMALNAIGDHLGIVFRRVTS